ncbi:MAG TPA: SEC-C metal-binding domain-containing protein, partial [Streptosporangiaceae bacterium]|nr:SEC-C metal-binding domain-containing protein [Streptosporangiaceae bacterium]
GTDIMLGGNPDFIADIELHRRELSPVETPEEYEAAWPEALSAAKKAVADEHEQVLAAGGLYVLGTERHESRRIDNQLRGRGGRQGDPGESRFYLSLEDDLMRMFNSARVGGLMERMNIPADVPVESKIVTRAIRSAQTQIEQQNFEIRKDVLKYDDVMNRQRKVVYAERRRVLEGADLSEQIRGFLDEVIADYVDGETAEGYPEEWDLDKLWRAFGQLYPIGITVDDVIEEAGGDKSGLSGDLIIEMVQTDAQAQYERRETELGPELMREFERRVVLSILDRKWREHLYEMDYLREGIGLRGYGQRDPLVEYQREGYDMFTTMMDGIKEESVAFLFNAQVQYQENPIVEEAGGNGTNGAVPPAFQQGQLTQQGQPPQQGPTNQAPAGQAPAGQVPAQPGQAQQQRTGGSRRSGGGAHARPAGGGQPAGPGGQGGQGGQGAPGGQVPAGLAPRRPRRLEYSGPSDGGGEVHSSTAAADDFAHVGRNDPCPCGSGRKYKRCHGDPRNNPS